MRKKIISYGLSAIVFFSMFAMAMPISTTAQMADEFGVNNASADIGTHGGVPVSLNNLTTAEEVALPADKWAVLIGIADYPGTENDLDSPDNDVADMYDVLTERCGFEAGQILVLLNESATKATITDAIETWLANNETADETVVIYYSGHGSYDTDDNGDEADGIDEFLCPYDTTADNTTMIRDDEFDTMLDALDSQKAVIILDSCFSGGMTKATKAIGRSSMSMGSLSERTLTETIKVPLIRSLADTPKALIIDGFKRDIAQPGRLVLMATDDRETGWEWPILDNGVFTYYLTWGLKSAEADNNSSGLVSFEEAFSYASPRVQTFVAVTIDPLWEETLEQHPQVDDKIDGDVDISIPVAQTWTECIDDGDEGVTSDINKVYFSLNPTDVSFRIEMNENINLSSFVSRTWLDVDQNSQTGYNDPSNTNDIGADYVVNVFVAGLEDLIGWSSPSLWVWNASAADFDFVSEIPDTYFDNKYIFGVPLGELNGDEGNMDVVQRVGYTHITMPDIYFDWTDIAPDTGHGTIANKTSGSVSGTITYACNGTGIEGATVKLTQGGAVLGAVLIIDDDNDVHFEDDQSVGTFQSAFEDMGYDVITEESDETSYSKWGDYDILVWSCGDDESPIYDKPPNPEYKKMLVDYVTDGGHLILESGDIASWIKQFGDQAMDYELREKVTHATTDWVYCDVGDLTVSAPYHPVATTPNILPDTIGFTPTKPGDDDSGDADAVRILPNAVGVYNWSSVARGGTPVNESIARISYGLIAYDNDTDVTNGGQIIYYAFDLDDIDNNSTQRKLVNNSANWLKVSARTVIDSKTTNANGTYEFTDVTPDDYYVNASKSGFWENGAAVTVSADGTTTADMMLWLKGDLNNNGAVDIGDVAKVANMVVGNVPKDPQADFNSNGDVDIGDAAKIANYFVGNIGAL